MTRRTDRTPGSCPGASERKGDDRVDQPEGIKQRRQRRRRRVIMAAVSGYLLASAGMAVVLMTEPDAAPAASAPVRDEVVFAAPAPQWSGGATAHAAQPAVRSSGLDAASQGKAKRVTVTVTPGDGENLTVATPPTGPRGTLTRGSGAAANVEDAWKLFQQAASADPDTPVAAAPKVTETTVNGLKSSRTVGGKAMTSSQIAKAAKAQSAVEDKPVEAAPASKDQWTLRLSAHDTRDVAADAAASAQVHLAHLNPEINVSPFVAVDDTADESQRYIALLAGFADERDAKQHAESLVRYGYRGQPLLVDFSSSR